MAYSVEILDSSLTPIGVLTEFPAEGGSVWLKYGRRLSHYRTASFRVSTRDPFIASGNNLLPYHNHVRIKRNGAQVWQGVILNNPQRTKDHWDVVAFDYLYLLSKILIQHDPAPKDINYRILDSGTFSSSIAKFITDAATAAPAGSILKTMIVGTIDNPVFPTGFVDANGAVLSGPWTWSTLFSVKYDYRDTLYAIDQLALYAICDYELVWNGTNLVFNLRTKIGDDITSKVTWDYVQGQAGILEDFNLPTNGQSMVNHLVGVAADNNFNIIKIDQSNQASITEYGQVDGVVGFIDAKTTDLLSQRVQQELLLVATPDRANFALLKPIGYPTGVWKLGDVIRLLIKHYGIQYDKPRRIVGYEVDVHLNGYEQIKVTLNNPRTT